MEWAKRSETAAFEEGDCWRRIECSRSALVELETSEKSWKSSTKNKPVLCIWLTRAKQEAGRRL